MTNNEALLIQSAILKSVDAELLTFHLEKQGLVAANDYTTENERALDLAHAGVLGYLITQPQTIRELDWQGTALTPGDLMMLRRSLLAKWGIKEPGAPTVSAPNVW